MDSISISMMEIIMLYFPVSDLKFQVIFMGKGFKLERLGIKTDKEKKFTVISKNKQILDVGWRERILKELKLVFLLEKTIDNDVY